MISSGGLRRADEGPTPAQMEPDGLSDTKQKPSDCQATFFSGGCEGGRKGTRLRQSTSVPPFNLEEAKKACPSQTLASVKRIKGRGVKLLSQTNWELDEEGGGERGG